MWFSRKASILVTLALGTVLLAGSGCGVRQNNSKLQKAAPKSILLNIDGPFYASGQNGESMSTPTCGVSGTGRPCARARASVGMPWGFDKNTNDGGSNVADAFALGPVAGTAHTTFAGAGKTRVTAGAAGSSLPAIQNRDLKIMQRQASSTDYVF